MNKEVHDFPFESVTCTAGLAERLGHRDDDISEMKCSDPRSSALPE